MNNIAAIPTTYRGVNFRSRLEARWAAFFDLIGWHWEYEPIDFQGWIPDFYIERSECHRRGKECSCYEKLYVEVKPIRDVEEFDDPVVMRCEGWDDFHFPAIAIFGINPTVTKWTTPSCSGDSGGYAELENDCSISSELDLKDLWNKAGNIVQWKAQR